ncbi:unnamed protein product [Aphanomyces euteiches]
MWKNAYLHFADKKRVDLTRENPTWPNGAISKELGRLWKGLSLDERNVWVNLAAYDRARYLAENQIETIQQSLSASDTTIEATYSELSSHSQDSTSLMEDSLEQNSFATLDSSSSFPVSAKRKRPTTNDAHTAFFFFRQAKKERVVAANPTLLPAQINKEIGRMWQKLKDDEKKPWIEMAIAMKLENTQVKPKDPLAPKAPKSAFYFFVESRRGRPDTDYNTLQKEASQEWRQMGTEDRAPWLKLATDDRDRYEIEMKQYQPPTYTATTCDFLAQEKTQTAYIYFFRERRKQLTELSFVELTQRISREWKQMSNLEKRPWIQIARDVRFQSECQEQPPKKATTQSKKTPPNLRAPKTAFVYYQIDKRREMNEMPYKAFVKNIASIWKNMPLEQKAPWLEMAKQDQERYAQEAAAQNQKASKIAISDMHVSQGSNEVQVALVTPQMKCEQKTLRTGGREAHEKQPVKPPSILSRNGFACFLLAKKHDLLARSPHLTHNELLHEVSKLWRALSPTEQQPWKDLVAPNATKKSQGNSLLEDSHLELMDGLWDDDHTQDDDVVTQHIFYEEDLAHTHHLSLPMMEDIEAVRPVHEDDDML